MPAFRAISCGQSRGQRCFAFEGLVDPYGPYEQTDAPPRRLWPFLKEYIQPFRAIFAVTGALSVLAAFLDVALLWYVGRLVDLGRDRPGGFLDASCTGPRVILVALAVLVLRPVLLVGNVALLHNTILQDSAR